MDPRTAATRVPDPDAVEFIRFCYRRRRVGWPELYDEMCAVAGRGLYRGYSADDLGALGIGFGLFDMPALAALARGIVDEEMALRRPVTVTITPLAVEFDEPVPPTVMVDTALEADVEAHVFAVATATPPEPDSVVELAARPEPTPRFRPVPAGA